MTGRDMTEADRDMLNRLLAEDESDLTVDDLLQLPAGAVSMFRLLVKSQQALGEIANQHHLDDCESFCYGTCAKRIARKHWKGK